MSARRVLLTLDRAVAVRELTGVVADLARSGALRPVVLVAGEALPASLAPLAGLSLDVVDLAGPGRDGRPAGGPADVGAGGARAGVGAGGARARVLASAWGEALATLRRQWRAAQEARRVLAAHRPALVVVTDDRALGQELALLHTARRRGVPVVVTSVAAADPAADARVRRQRPRCTPSPWLMRVLSRAVPGQVLPDPAGALVFYPPLVVLALALLGQLPPRPWVLGASGGTAVAGFDLQAPEGLAPARYAAVGQPSLDALGSPGARETARRTVGAGRAERVLCCALPQLAEHGLLDWQQHDDDVRWLLAELVATGWSVVVSLHPRADPERYRAVVQAAGAHLAEAPLRDVLPAADAFVATASSTLRWAALLGIPTLVVDHLQLSGDAVLPGQVLSRTRSDLADGLRRLLADDGQRRQLGTQLRAAAEQQYVPLDGRAGERLVRLLASVAGGPS